jgi:hypothetical protein
MNRAAAFVYVVDAWDDSAGEAYVRVFTTAEKANRDLERWKAKRKKHDVYAGVWKRKVLD